jgi:hypothetical protein
MKKREWEMKTDHFRLRLVWDELEPKDYEPVPITNTLPMPERYVMIGPPGEGAMARIDEQDARMILPQLQEFFGPPYPGMMQGAYFGPLPGGPPRGMRRPPGAG